MAAATASAAAAVADHDQRIGAGKLRRQRRAQGTGGKHAAIAEAAVAVDHDQRGILGDRGILETVVHQDHAGALRARQRDAVDAIARDHHRNRPRQHQRLVADIGRDMARGIDLDRPVQSPAIAAAEHHRRLAEIAQQLGQRQHRRGLAGAADVIIADAKHGDAGVKALALQSLAGDQAIDGAERHQ